MTAERLDLYAATPKTLAHLVAEAGDDRLDAAGDGEWPVRVILAHLRDVEMFSGRLRYERMLAEEAPVFADFDEDAWAANRNRTRDRKDRLLGDFALQRQATVSMLRSIRPEEWQRTGSHSYRGEFTVSTWLDACLDHDAQHVAQVERLLGETLDDVLRRRSRPDW
jgi:hypothetical protein